MPHYRYKARDKHGKLQTGTVEAGGREAVADQLAAAQSTLEGWREWAALSPRS